VKSKINMIFIPTLAILILRFCPCSANAAWPASQKVVIANEIPYGENESALLAAGSAITGLLCVENRRQEDVRIDLTVETLLSLDPGAGENRLSVVKEGDRSTIHTSFSLEVEGQKWFSPLSITIPEDASPGEYVIVSTARATSGEGVEELHHIARLKVVSKEGIAGLFDLGEALLPSNEKGEPEERQERNTVLIKGEKSFWRGMVEDRKGSNRMEVKPAAYVTAPVENRTPCRALLLVRMDVLDPRNGKRAPGFEIPYAAEHGDALGEEAVYQVEDVAPGSIERVVLPVYTNEDTVEPGVYTARIRVFLFGTNIEAGHREWTVKVVGTRRMPAVMTILALCTAMTGIGFSFWKRKRLFNMKGRELILIALFGTVIFAVVNIPGTLLSNIANVLLGPFSFLLTGFFYETLFYILLAALIVLIPRTGVVSLVIAVRFLMGSFVMGEFSPLGIVYYSTSATCLEAAVHFLGLTRGAGPSGWNSRSGSPSTKRIFFVALVLGLVDVYLSFIFFNLGMFFYRLYYATWYLAVHLAINGFLFTFIAVPFGFKLGNRLKATTIG